MDRTEQVELVIDVEAEVIPGPTNDVMIELNQVELVLGSGTGDIHF